MIRVRLRGNFLVDLPEPEVLPGTLAAIRDPGHRGVQLAVTIFVKERSGHGHDGLGPMIEYIDGDGDISMFAFTEWVRPDAWDPADGLVANKEIVVWCP